MLRDPGPMLRSHTVRTLEDRVRILRRLVWLGDQAFDPRAEPIGGIRDARMRQIGLEVTKPCRARDDQCELQAIYWFVKNNVRYTGDITRKDTFQSAYRTLQFGGGDCLPATTRVLLRDRADIRRMKEVPLHEVRAGDQIAEDGRWTEVLKIWSTGVKPLLRFRFDDRTPRESRVQPGALVCTGEHRLFHASGAEVRAENVRVGDQLLSTREPMEYQQREKLGWTASRRVVEIALLPQGDACMDLTTHAGRFWLPESDLIVHNCDDHSVLCAVLALENGFETKFRITSNTGATWDHIFCMAGVPKGSQRSWIALDTTLPRGSAGTLPPMASYKDFEVKEP